MFKLINVINSLIRSLFKWLLHALTNKCEIERICNSKYSYKMSYKIFLSIKQSKKLITSNKIILYPKMFSSLTQSNNICTIKRIEQLSIKHNLVLSLENIRFINIIRDQLNHYKRITFNKLNNNHIYLIESLFKNLKPNQLRDQSKDILLSTDWTDIGFQNIDPSTDFRGMGLLGLIQLEYFSKVYPDISKAILSESIVEKRYFPFAATGINITAYVLELIEQYKLHKYLMIKMNNNDKFSKYISNYDSNIEVNDKLMIEWIKLDGLTYIHDIYCEIYDSFCKLWVKRNPPDLMSFPIIFNELKLIYNNKY